MIIRRDEAFKAVCELTTPVNDNSSLVGTGMFVSSPTEVENRFYGWIVTASHVAKKTNENTSIVISTKEGKAVVLPIAMFGPIAWEHHSVADISVFKIQFNPINKQFMTGRFFPYDHFNLEESVVSRDYELTSIGFPNGLGTDGLFSPFSFRSYASSGFVTLPRADTKTPSTFFCLENPSCGGYSGCPVFDLGYSENGVFSTVKEKTVCHGFMHGTLVDKTGGKIAMVTPAFYLRDLIENAK